MDENSELNQFGQIQIFKEQPKHNEELAQPNGINLRIQTEWLYKPIERKQTEWLCKPIGKLFVGVQTSKSARIKFNSI